MGNTARMDSERTPDADRVHQRAEELLTDEIEAGSDDPEAEAFEILAESDERTLDRDGSADDLTIEHRRSEDTVLPE